jgi:hypothetical protein
VIVIDLGCATYGENDSVRYLVERFKPDALYGFDPVLSGPAHERRDGTNCTLAEFAAYTYTGTVGFLRNGTGSTLDDEADERVRCFDIAEFIAQLPETDIVLKLDVEGAEYDILQRLRECGLDERLTLVLVEWHGSHEPIPLRCPVEEWPL